MDIQARFRKTAKEHSMIPEGAHIVVGLSGGPDSVCLTELLQRTMGDRQIAIHPVHVNHRLRPGDAEEDEEYVKAYCRERQLPLKVFHFDCEAYARQRGLSTEDAGRLVRYEKFYEEAARLEETGIPREKIRVAVAHNLDDQAETILFRIIRGTGIDGLSGIPYVRESESGVQVIRPLLDCKRSDIEEYLEDCGIQPRIDRTNYLPIYARNRIRLNLIPEMEEISPGAKEALVRLGHIAETESRYLREQAEEALFSVQKAEEPGAVLLDDQGLRAMDKGLRYRVIRLALDQLGGSRDISMIHLEEVDRIIFSQSPSAETHLPGGFQVYRIYRNLKIRKGDGEDEANGGIPYEITVMTAQDYRRLAERQQETAVFDYDLLEQLAGPCPEKQIVYRTRREGDRLAIRGGSQKLQNFFVDRKIPRVDRDRIHFYAAGSRVLFIPAGGLFGSRSRYAAGLQVSADTQKVLIIRHNC